MAFGNPFTNMFGHSPIKPIQEHMAKALQCANELIGFFEAVLEDDWQKAKACQEEIKALENEADVLKKNLRVHLPKSLFMPVPRSDLLELLSMQDKIANSAKDIAGLMLGRKMTIPAAIAPAMLDFVKESVVTAKRALTAIQELDELLEAGFSGREIHLIETLIRELDEQEHKTDILQVAIRAQLFKLEDQLPPVNVMFLYKIIDRIGELADRAQKVGSRLQLLIAR